MKRITTTIAKFVANDGTEFENEESCRIYEKENQSEWVEEEVYLHADKWEVYESVKDKYVFDENDSNLSGRLKYILSEVKVGIRLNTQTGEYEILSVNGKKLQ